MNLRTALLTLCSLIVVASSSVLAQDRIRIEGVTDPSKLIPLSISGYSGEVEAVLKFDLEVAGFQLVGREESRFHLAGSNAGVVEGVLTERATKTALLANRYTGGNTRYQAHHLADDIVQKVTGTPGIARTRIAFKGQNGKETEIYVADYDGANAVPVSRDGALIAAPAWVASREQILYTSYKSGYADIVFHDLRSSERKIIASYPGLNTSPAVSPDGRRLAMILSKGGSPDLYVADLDGRNLKQLTKTREEEASPCWSPDGKTICFVSAARGPAALYLIGPEGGEMRRLVTKGVAGRAATEPDWSPDGKWIVFTVNRGRESDICMVPAGGGDVITLTSGEDPSWAPNSRTIIFTRKVRGRSVLSLLDVPTKRVKDVAQNLGSCSQPSWAK
jgi:TolB protein